MPSAPPKPARAPRASDVETTNSTAGPGVRHSTVSSTTNATQTWSVTGPRASAGSNAAAVERQAAQLRDVDILEAAHVDRGRLQAVRRDTEPERRATALG